GLVSDWSSDVCSSDLLFADDGVPDQLLMAIQHMRDFANAHGRAGHGYLGKRFRGSDRQLVTNIESLVRRLDEAAGTRRGRVQVGERRGPHCLTGRLDHLLKLDAVLLQVSGIDLHLYLPLALPPYRDIRNARHAG